MRVNSDNSSVSETKIRQITFAQAINEALAEEMRRDPTVFIIGEDVAEAGTPFKVLSGLVKEFGTKRVIDSPISEAGIAGIGVGAAMTGMRPVVDIMFGDFLTLTMDQLVNQAAKIRYMSGGKLKVPLVLRTTLGAARRSAAQHSQSLHAWVSHIPGLKVVVPATPYDAKGLLKSAIRDDNPVVFFEDKMMYQLRGSVPEEEYTIPLGVADIKRTGTDITLVATSSMVQVALEAAGSLHEADISAEVIDVQDHRAARQRYFDRISQKNQPGDRHRRRIRKLWCNRRNRIGDCGRRILLSRCAGKAHGCDGRARTIFARARRSDGPDVGESR